MEAFSFAAGIVQFVQFSHFLLIGTQEILGSAAGLQAKFAQSEDIAGLTQKHLRSLSHSIEKKWTGSSGSRGGLENHENDQEREMFRELHENCQAVSGELLALIASLKRSDRSKRFQSWDAFVKLIRGAMKKDRIEALDKRLKRMSALLNLQGMGVILRRLDVLQQENRRLHATRSPDIELLRAEIKRTINSTKNNRSQGPRSWAQLPEIIDACQTYTAEQEILNSLKFDTISERFLGISDAHSKTFEWIFGDTAGQEPSESVEGERPALNFVQWLESDEPVYWISGKPGSGKSTLMKYILEHEATNKHLQKWADGDEIEIVSFFFWAAAKDKLQKSQEGLLRTILYNILRKRPREIQHTLPDLWQHYQPMSYLDDDPSSETSSSAKDIVGELLEALSKILRSSEKSKHKLFFVLDGLDEYDGDPKEVIELLKLMKVSVNVKFCLASRSWNEFEEAYGSQSPWKLYMQDLTKGDIALFVQDKLEKNERFQALRKNDRRCPDFVQEIVTSAEGIFLWVSLVIMSLLDGLTNDDRIEDLQKRLRQLPTDLDKLFDHILATISPFYREHAAHLLLVALCTPRTLSMWTYWLIDQERRYDPRTKPESYDEVQYQLQRMPGRLNTLSKGLLQVSSNKTMLGIPLEGCDRKTDFLHRTVVEYLNDPRIRSKLESWSNKQFNAYVAICEGLLVQVTMLYGREFGSTRRLMQPAINCFYETIEAMESEDDLEVEEIHYMKTMTKILRDCEKKSGVSKRELLQAVINYPEPVGVDEIAIAMNLVKYLQDVNEFKEDTLKYGLSFLLNTHEWRRLRDYENFLWKYVKTLRILLEKGCLPNEMIDGDDYSVWANYIRNSRTYKDAVLGGRDPPLRVAIITALLEFGADPQAECLTKREGSKETCTAKHHLQRILTTNEYADLKHLIEPSLATRAKSKLFGSKKKWRPRGSETAKRK